MLSIKLRRVLPIIGVMFVTYVIYPVQWAAWAQRALNSEALHANEEVNNVSRDLNQKPLPCSSRLGPSPVLLNQPVKSFSPLSLSHLASPHLASDVPENSGAGSPFPSPHGVPDRISSGISRLTFLSPTQSAEFSQRCIHVFLFDFFFLLLI